MAFLLDLALLTFIAVPAAIIYVLWRIFVTNRRNPPTSVFGLALENRSATESEVYWRKISGWKLVLYGVMTVLTFDLGAPAFDLLRYSGELLSELLWQIS